jgi:hypothetical protein
MRPLPTHTLLLSAVLAGSAAAQVTPVQKGEYAQQIGAPSSPRFGEGLALTDQVALVGDPANDIVSFFDRATGDEILQLGIGSLQVEPGSDFGAAVAADRDTGAFVIAASRDDASGLTDCGSVFLAAAGGGILEVRPQDSYAGQRFGTSVAIDGGYCVVGASLDDEAGFDAGAVYVFDATTGAQLHKLTAQGAENFDGFGFSVAVDGDVIAVGAPFRGLNGASSGAVYLYHAVTGAPLGQYDGELLSDAYLGWSVALEGNLLLAGAPQGSAGIAVDGPGRVRLIDLNLSLTVGTFNPHDGLGVNFGRSVAFRDGKAVIGEARNWVQVRHVASGALELLLAPATDPASPLLARGVAVSGDDVLVQGNLRVHRFGAPGTGWAFCSGDGAGAACPCGVDGEPGMGCPNSTGVGASLAAEGLSYLSNDTLQLVVEGAAPGSPGLMLRGASQVAGGAGLPVGNGLLCVTGASARSQVVFTGADGSAVVSDFHGTSLGAASYGAGVPTGYQFWYRDSASTCAGQPAFNLSNAWVSYWLP